MNFILFFEGVLVGLVKCITSQAQSQGVLPSTCHFLLTKLVIFFIYSFFFSFSISFSSLYLSIICLFISATKIKEQNNSNSRQAKINNWKNKLTAFEDNGFLNIIIKYVYEKIFFTMKIINVNIKTNHWKFFLINKKRWNYF